MSNKIKIATLFSGEEINDIDGYHGVYAITTFGRVWSYPKPQGNRIDTKGSFLKPQTKRNGYLGVTLQKNHKKRHVTIHRLVASAFILNHGNKATVNHIDGDKHNNNVENLEWATQEENQAHADSTGLNKVKGIDNPRFKKWWFRKNGVTVFPNTTIKDWCKSNLFDESTVYKMIKENRTAKSGKLLGYQIGFIL